MPPEQRIFGPHEYETYRQYQERLREDDSRSPARAAALMATTILMKGRSNKVVDREEYYKLYNKMQKQPAFRGMMQEREARELLRKGSGAGLLKLYAEREAARLKTLERYQRPQEYVKEDASFLNTAIEGLRKRKPAPETPEAQQRGAYYEEMMKRLDRAKTLADEGKQLSGEQTKELIGSVLAYNDAGNLQRPGGEREAEGHTEAMCVLSRYMPERDFRGYCRKLNQAKGVTKTTQKEYEDPENYPADRLTGYAKTAEEWFAESRTRLMKSFSLEGCAQAAALQKLCKGNPKKVIRPEELDRETLRMSAPGSALARTLRDDKAREEFMHLATMGEAQELGSELVTAARKHSARAAQWQVNQSIRALTSGPVNTYFAAENLANILAARELAAAGDAGAEFTNSAFRARAEQLRSDPSFQRLAARYTEDPTFRRKMNLDLSADASGAALQEEYKKAAAPVRAQARQRREQQPVREQEEPQLARERPQ